MHMETVNIKLPEGFFSSELQFFDGSDLNVMREIYVDWVNLSDRIASYGGRRINLPEVLSEALYCLNFRAGRVTTNISGASTSFDCYNLETAARVQVKASSVEEDLTSFGPNSVFDELYFVHMYPLNIHAPRYRIYALDKDLVLGTHVNSSETLEEQQESGRRPRLSLLRQVIRPNLIRPIVERVL